MKAFHTIAIPHKDILDGRLTMDVFAADLWEVSQKRGADEYKDAETFFRKTYLTEGLQNLLVVVEKRLQGAGGDPVIQIQTPFGGGKTHALIAMYHKAAEWGAKKVVIVGTALSTDETFWGILEKRLSGKVTRFTGQVSPGKEAVRELLDKYQPILILMDEVLEYVTKAAGVKVADSTLASQTIAFMQELTEAVSTLEKVCLVVTLPSSIIEHYDEGAEKLYQQLQKVTGRIEKIYTPVQDNEIAKIIRRRLFSNVHEDACRKAVQEFIRYADREEILPVGMQLSEYRGKFVDSYPFMPEVIEVLYQRWGSYSTFQRTRGVLRLLSLVVYSLKSINKPYISLADFDLANQEIRQELLKHPGSQINSVIAADITDVTAGSSKVDLSLGKSYQGLRLGTRAATATFMYSFSGGTERGATLGEIKRSATTIENPASVVAEAVEQLKGKLFYLQNVDEKYFFNNQPNINRILLTYMENIREERVTQTEFDLLRANILGDKLNVYVWETSPNNIPDSELLKLVVLNKQNQEAISSILKTKGQTPRVCRNTIFFLYPMESERAGFINTVKRSLAWESIERDQSLNLSDEQRRQVKQESKRVEADVKEWIRRLYRLVAIPVKEGTKEIDLGIPTYGNEVKIDQEVFDKLRSCGEILARVAPLVLKEKYLSGKDYVQTGQLYQSSLSTPGETRLLDKRVLEQGITEGVCSGLFGLGDLENGKPICRYYREQPSIAFSGNEVLINEATCVDQKNKTETGKSATYQPTIATPLMPGIEGEGKKLPSPSAHTKNKVELKFEVPKGKVSSIMGVMNLLQSKFGSVQVEIVATDGEISERDYEDKIMEAFRQLGIDTDKI